MPGQSYDRGEDFSSPKFHKMQFRLAQILISSDRCVQLVNGGEDVLVFYNDRSSFPVLLQMMGSERDRTDEDGALAYHNTLVELLAACTEGKNVYTELKCNSLLPLDDIVRVVTDIHCVPEVKIFWTIFIYLDFCCIGNMSTDAVESFLGNFVF